MDFQKTKIELIFPDLRYRVVGCAYKVHNGLGGSQLEKAYQKVMEIEFQKMGRDFIFQKQCAVTYFDSKIRTNIPDFIIEKKLLLI